MTLREFLEEVGVDVIEDTQGTLDLEIVTINNYTDKDIIFKYKIAVGSSSVEINYKRERIYLTPSSLAAQ